MSETWPTPAEIEQMCDDMYAQDEAERRHVGWHKWKNGAELVWVCSRNCPHPSHEDDEP